MANPFWQNENFFHNCPTHKWNSCTPVCELQTKKNCHSFQIATFCFSHVRYTLRIQQHTSVYIYLFYVNSSVLISMNRWIVHRSSGSWSQPSSQNVLQHLWRNISIIFKSIIFIKTYSNLHYGYKAEISVLWASSFEAENPVVLLVSLISLAQIEF